MPPQRPAPTQQRISFLPTPSNTFNPRGTPRRQRTTIENYAYPERIDELIINPPQTPRHPHPPRLTVEDDVDIADGDDDKEEQEIEEELEIDQSRTPTRWNIPSTIVVKTRRKTKRPRKP
jgi:hypothetical protein